MASNVIHVPDDVSVHRRTRRLIQSCGYQTAVLEFAETFLKPGQLNDASSLVVDIQIPGRNGYTSRGTSLLSAGAPPNIFITAYENKESHRRAMLAGAVAFLDKRFSDKQLLETIHSAVQLDTGDKENK